MAAICRKLGEEKVGMIVGVVGVYSAGEAGVIGIVGVDRAEEAGVID